MAPKKSPEEGVRKVVTCDNSGIEKIGDNKQRK